MALIQVRSNRIHAVFGGPDESGYYEQDRIHAVIGGPDESGYYEQ